MLKKILLLTVILSLSNFSIAKEIVKERSIYRNVTIVEEKKLRCMRFETRRKRVTNQACIDLKDNKRLVFEYLHGIMAGFALNKKPKRILILGLGGGVLSKLFHEISPETEIVSVDIDPVVVKLAKKYFDYRENDKIKTVIQDGRVYVKRAILKKESFDWIVLDAFNGDYIPEHLMTREFLNEVKSLLTPNGILTANTFSNSKLYDYESVTYQDVFKKLHIFDAPTKGNRIIFACNCENFDQFPELEESLNQKMQPYSVNLKKVWKRISDKVDWNTNSLLLTDQYSPANLLKKN